MEDVCPMMGLWAGGVNEVTATLQGIPWVGSPALWPQGASSKAKLLGIRSRQPFSVFPGSVPGLFPWGIPW